MDIRETLTTRKGLLSITELAELFGRNRQTIWRWAKAGKLPAIRVGAKIAFDPGAILKVVEARQL